MKQKEHTLVDGTLSHIITADFGKRFSRKSDGVDFGKEIWLGYRYDGDNKVLEVPEDFEEVDDTQELDIEQLESMINDELDR